MIHSFTLSLPSPPAFSGLKLCLMLDVEKYPDHIQPDRWSGPLDSLFLLSLCWSGVYQLACDLQSRAV